MSEETVVVSSSLDEFIAEQERAGIHVEGTDCEYRLNKGQPLSHKRCQMCTKLSPLIDLSVSWTQKINTGRLTGRSIEIIETPGVRTTQDADMTWKLYRECSAIQTPLLRRYYASFTCGSGHYLLRDVTSTSTGPIDDMIAQLVTFYHPATLPPTFIHGNPTVSSISFMGRLPIPLKHEHPEPYSSRYLLQIDFGGGDSAAITALSAKQGEITPSHLVADTSRGRLSIRADTTFPIFLREYPRHWKLISLFLLTRGLLSLYSVSENRDYIGLVGRTSSAKNIREAFEEIRGGAIPLTLQSALCDVRKKRSIS